MCNILEHSKAFIKDGMSHFEIIDFINVIGNINKDQRDSVLHYARKFINKKVNSFEIYNIIKKVIEDESNVVSGDRGKNP